MPDFDGTTLASDDTLPLSSEDEGGHPASHPPGEFDTPDDVVPTVAFMPTSGNVLDPSDDVQVDVVDDVSGDIGGLLRVIIVAVYTDGTAELVYTGTAYTSDFASSTTGAITDGTRYTITRDGDGWLDDFQLRVYAFDTGGNEPAAQPTVANYTVPDGVGTGGDSDAVAPIVDNYDPAVGSTITATQALSFDVTDDTGTFSSIVITAYFPDGSWEVIHTGTQFAPRYAASSSRAAIANGFRYTCRRVGGWSGNPTIVSFPVDAAGNVSV